MPLHKLQTHLQPLVTNKRVAILGFGREGQSTYKVLRRIFPNLQIAVIDQVKVLPQKAVELLENDKHTEVLLGASSFSQLASFDTIFKSPGVSPYLIEVQDAINCGATVTSQTDIFFALFGSQVVAVTGTKGKSTTCQVISQVLEQAGEPVVFLGNIGVPAFDAHEQISNESTIVYETSSHQCEGIHHSPHIGVMLNLFEDHLDYYPSVEAYGQAKKQLFTYQSSSDYCLYSAGDSRVTDLIQNLPGKKVGFSLTSNSQSSVFTQDGWIISFGEKLMPVNEIPLLGKHNLLNVMPAVIVAKLKNIPAEKVRQYLGQITPVGGRLETVGVINDIKFVDDALATIPEATMAALEALGSEVETLIVGGFDRGQDFSQLAKAIVNSNVKTVLWFPTTGQKIANLISDLGSDISLISVKTMDEAVKTALSKTAKGKTVLLSTASASFGLFADYRDRSKQLLDALHRQGLQKVAEEGE